nr:reverse transcriptase domain-containing protein [Tanacetum cinerariifolium]
TNRGLKRILERTVGENRASWSDKLEEALWAFLYGKACHLPLELEHKAYWALKHVNFDLKLAGDHRKLQLNELNELRDQAYENSLIYKERTKKLHDDKIKNRIFNVGDQVLLFNSRLKIFSEKLIKAIRTCLKNNNQPPEEKSIAILLAEESILTVMQTLEEKQIDTESMQELLLQLFKDLQTLVNTSNQLKQEEQDSSQY